MDDNYISLMDQQAVSQLIQYQPYNALGTVNQHVLTKSNDYNKVDLQTLKNNQSLIIFTQTPGQEWLTFEFIRKEKLLKIIGQLYSNDLRTYSIESQYLDSKQQWVPNFNAFFIGQLEQTFLPPITAYGIRFKGRSNIDDSLQFMSLNIFAKANRPYVLGQNPWDNAFYLHDKYEIVDIMNYQPVYKKIDNLIIVNKRPVVTKQFDESNYCIDELNDNKNQDISSYCPSQKWLTFEFQRKYKLSKLEIQLYNQDRRRYDYEVEVMDKKQNWRQVDASKSGFKPIQIEFPNFFSSYGIRIRGKAAPFTNIVVVSLKILAQRGKPIQI